MTPEKRLDQIEPLLAEHSALLDLHTGQLRRIAHGIQAMSEGIGQQSDNISFVLESQAKQGSRLAKIEAVQAEHTQTLAQHGEMLQAILNILQKRSNN
jgi:uncharacterized coiled-coil protein SlyX